MLSNFGIYSRDPRGSKLQVIMHACSVSALLQPNSMCLIGSLLQNQSAPKQARFIKFCQDQLPYDWYNNLVLDLFAKKEVVRSTMDIIKF